MEEGRVWRAERRSGTCGREVERRYRDVELGEGGLRERKDRREFEVGERKTWVRA
jgi:hypothetical protein